MCSVHGCLIFIESRKLCTPALELLNRRYDDVIFSIMGGLLWYVILGGNTWVLTVVRWQQSPADQEFIRSQVLRGAFNSCTVKNENKLMCVTACGLQPCCQQIYTPWHAAKCYKQRDGKQHMSLYLRSAYHQMASLLKENTTSEANG